MYKTKILDALKAKFEGVAVTILSRVADKLAKTVTKEEEVETAVDGVSFQQIIEAESDRRATDATQSAVANYEKKHNLKEGKPVTGGAQEPETEPTPIPADMGANNADLAKLIADAIKPFADKIAGLEAGKIADTRKQQLDAVISNASEKYKTRISKYYGRMSWKDDEDYNAWLEEIRAEAETDATDVKATGAAFGIPFAGGKQSANKAIEQDIKDWAARNKPQNN